MLPPNTRLNYFDHQFLRRDDFVDEQAYHLGMRRAHNRMLHTPGVAQGLVVEPDGSGVTVSEGVAIDAEGRELVLDDDVTRDLSDVEGSPLWVTLVYREERADRTNETGAEGDRRWVERGEVGVTATPPANDGLTLVLARVNRGEGGVLKIDDGEGAARRRPASAVGGELSAATLDVRGAARAASLAVTGGLAAEEVQAATLTVRDAAEIRSLVAGTTRLGETDVSGTLSADAAKLGPASVNGDLAVTGALSVDKDATVNGSVLSRADGRFAGRVAVGGAAGDAQLHIAGGNGNVFSSEGDFKIGNASIRMKMGIGIGANPGDARIQVQGGAARLAIGTAGADVINIQNSGVGIATAPISAGGLSVAGSLHFVGGGVLVADRRLFSPADGVLRWQAPPTAAGGRAFEVGLSNGAVGVRMDAAGPSFITGGFLGIGVVNPDAMLQISGGRDVQTTEGDLKIGTGPNRLRVGVITTGATAGETRLRVDGTAPRILLNAGGADMVNVAPTGVGIGAGVAPLPGTVLNVGGAINATEFLKNGAPLTSQWANVAGGISYAAGGVGIGRAPVAGVRLAVEGGIGFGNSAAPMLYVYESGDSNAERAVAAHSPAFPTWGLFYRDLDDRMVFRTGGVPVLTADLAGRRVGIGTDAPVTALHVASVGAWDVINSDGDVLIGTATHKLRIGVATAGGGAGDVRLRAVGGSNRLMLGAGTAADMVAVQNDLVGVGTISPTHRLHVMGPENVALFQSTTPGAYIRLATGAGIDDRIELCNRGNGTAAIWVPGFGDALTINRFAVASFASTLSVQNLQIRSGAKPGYVFDHFVNQTGDPVEQGDVVVIGGNDATEFWATESNIPIPEVDLASRAYDTRVCGIVERVVTEGELPYAEMREVAKPKAKRGRGKKAAESEAAEDAAHPLGRYAAPEDTDRKQVGPGQLGNMVTMGAYAHCKVDADIAPIQAGDLLTTSPTRGHAQKVLDPAAAVGAIVGKALGSLESGRGKIPVLVMLQ